MTHTSAHIDHPVPIGDDCYISPGAKILRRVKIGKNCNFGSGALILSNNTSGDNITGGAGTVEVADCLSENTAVDMSVNLFNKNT